MINEYILRKLREHSPQASDENIYTAVKAARRMLGNLIHYQNGRTREDDDVIMMSAALLSLLQEKQP